MTAITVGIITIDEIKSKPFVRDNQTVVVCRKEFCPL